MSDETVEQLRARRQTLLLANLYLDPNNFRFVDRPEYRPVAPEDVFKPDVQRRTTAFILGKSQGHVRDLIDSIKENGWLDIDPILVERRGGGRFLVVEGNRRVATLKHLERRYQDNAIDLGRLDKTLFSKVPVVLHESADERQHLVMMGLHHISGKQRWPAINRAEAMKRLYEQFGHDANAVCRALGVIKRDFNRSLRTLALVDAYKESDYGDQFHSEKYTLFREILGTQAMRDWLAWDNETCTASNRSNLDRLFKWMSNDVELNEEKEENEDVDAWADVSPVISTLEHVRELARMIEDPAAVKRLDETRSLQKATLSSNLLVKGEIDRAFEQCDNGIQGLSKMFGELEAKDFDRIDQLTDRLEGLRLAQEHRRPGPGGRLPWQPFNELTQSQFSSLYIEHYRGMEGLQLDDLCRVNLVAGVNNAGKTSLLEAVYLLAHQNDERALFDVLRWRGRLEGEPDPLWLVEQIPPAIRIEGRFDKVPRNSARLDVQRVNEPGDDVTDQTSFLAKLAIESGYGGHDQSTDVTLFSDRPRRTSFQGRHWLCRSAFTSPFWANRGDTLAKANKAGLEAKTKAKVIDFIKQYLDPGITNIELTDKFNRFLVSHRDFDSAPDLSSFGDGLRRIFEMGLLLASVRGGVLLIDEFESAIHKELLDPFTRMVQELAVELNVQVFLTTHSKETLDAFVANECRTNSIAVYAIRRSDDGVGVRRFDGNQLQRLHKAVDFDPRGIR